MEGARKMDVIAINSGKGDHGQTPCADISLHLARHGIEAAAQSITVNDIGVSDMLLSRAAHMLNYMTIPVLMSN